MSVRAHEHDTVASLLRDYRPDSFFLASPRGVVLASSPSFGLTSPDEARSALADAQPGTLLVGAFPFDLRRPARAGLAERVRHAAPMVPGSVTMPRSTGAVRWSWSDPDPAAYQVAVARVLDRISAGDLRKVVLARSVELTANRPVRPAELLTALAAGDPSAYVFATDLGRRTLLGASPELLVSRRCGTVLANPIVGSSPRDPDPVQDGHNATALLRSVKDHQEHHMVVDRVADALAPLCRRLRVPKLPELLRTAQRWHLSSRVTALPREGVTALDLALALHPTPAVCGRPADSAREVINEVEPFRRDFYTGIVGWTDTWGDGEWAIALRCGELRDTSLRLYAGAGVVEASTPEEEAARTSAQLRTLLSALGAGEAVS